MILLPSLKAPIGIFRLLFVLWIILYFLINNKFKGGVLNRYIWIYSLYLFILCFFSSDLSESMIDGFIKVFISIMMIPIGVYLGNNDNYVIFKIVFWLLLLLIINYGIAQFLKIGNSLYDADSFYSGGATATTPVIIALCVLVLLNGLNTGRLSYYQIINILVISISVFIVLLSLKRGAILAMGSGLIFYFIFSSNRTILSFRMLFIGVALLFILSQYFDDFNKRLDARTTERNSLENENRYKETFFILNEIENSSVINLLFGKEAFNSKKVMRKYFGRERQLHVDYNVLLHGTGFIGLVMYLVIFFRLFLHSRFYNLIVKDKNLHKKARQLINENHALIISMIILSLVMSFSGGLQFSSYRIILFLFIGYFLGQSQKVVSIIHVKKYVSTDGVR